MANNLVYTGGGRGSGGLDKIPKASPAGGLGKSKTNIKMGFQIGQAAISAYSAYASAKHATKMKIEEIRHNEKMADIELSLMNTLSARQLDDVERQAGEKSMEVMIAQMVAESATVVQAAGTGNESGASRVLRQTRQSEANAKNAVRADLSATRINLAQGRFNVQQRHAERTAYQRVDSPNPFSYVSNFGMNAIKIGQSATARKDK